MDHQNGAAPVVNLGSFVLYRAERRLMRGDQTVELGETTIEILQALVDSSDRVIGKQELLAMLSESARSQEIDVWSHISQLNQALQTDGPHYIAHFPGLGYQFIGVIEVGTK